MKNHQLDFTKGSITRNLFLFSLPFFFTSVIQSLYNVVDVLIVGHFCGAAGVAGTSIGGSLTFTITGVIINLCNGGAIMTAQYAGMKNQKSIRETVGTMFSVMILLGIATTLLMLCFTDFMLKLLNTPPEAFEQTRSYFIICMSGSIFIFGYNAISSVLRGLGDSKTTMYFGIISCLINVVLDLYLVAVLKWEAAGAALATIISQAIALICCIVYLKKLDFIFDFKLKSFRIVPQKAFQIVKLGFPQAVQSFIVSGGFLMVSSITNSLGVNVASGVAIASKVNGFAQMPAQAIGTAVSSMIGQNVGAGQYDRASRTLKTSIIMGLIAGIVVFAVVQLIPKQLMGLLISDPEVINAGLPYLRITALDYLLVALVFPLNALCNGSGHTAFTMFPSIFSSVVARVPVAYFCTKVLHLGISGVAISTPTGTISAIIICTIFYLSGRWKNNTLHS